jgi:hypothetical protein
VQLLFTSVRSASRALLEREDALPVVLHADHRPAVLLSLVVKRLSEGADLGVRQALRRTVGIFALRVVVQHEHHQPRTVARPRVLQHLPIPSRVGERRIGTPTNHQVNALGLAKGGERDPVRLREAGLAALSNSNVA